MESFSQEHSEKVFEHIEKQAQETEQADPAEKIMAMLGRLELLVMHNKLANDFEGGNVLEKIHTLYRRFKAGEKDAVTKEAFELTKKAKEYMSEQKQRKQGGGFA